MRIVVTITELHFKANDSFLCREQEYLYQRLGFLKSFSFSTIKRILEGSMFNDKIKELKLFQDKRESTTDKVFA